MLPCSHRQAPSASSSCIKKKRKRERSLLTYFKPSDDAPLNSSPPPTCTSLPSLSVFPVVDLPNWKSYVNTRAAERWSRAKALGIDVYNPLWGGPSLVFLKARRSYSLSWRPIHQDDRLPGVGSTGRSMFGCIQSRLFGGAIPPSGRSESTPPIAASGNESLLSSLSSEGNTESGGTKARKRNVANFIHVVHWLMNSNAQNAVWPEGTDIATSGASLMSLPQNSLVLCLQAYHTEKTWVWASDSDVLHAEAAGLILRPDPENDPYTQLELYTILKTVGDLRDVARMAGVAHDRNLSPASAIIAVLEAWLLHESDSPFQLRRKHKRLATACVKQLSRKNRTKEMPRGLSRSTNNKRMSAARLTEPACQAIHRAYCAYFSCAALSPMDAVVLLSTDMSLLQFASPPLDSSLPPLCRSWVSNTSAFSTTYAALRRLDSLDAATESGDAGVVFGILHEAASLIIDEPLCHSDDASGLAEQHNLTADVAVPRAGASCIVCNFVTVFGGCPACEARIKVIARGVTLLERERSYSIALHYLRVVLSSLAVKQNALWRSRFTLRLIQDTLHIGNVRSAVDLADSVCKELDGGAWGIVSLPAAIPLRLLRRRLSVQPYRHITPPIPNLVLAIERIIELVIPPRRERKALGFQLENEVLSNVLRELGDEWNGCHAENAFGLSIFGLLCWNIIFAPHECRTANDRGCWLVRHQAAPLDFRLPGFGPRIATSLEALVEDIINGRAPDIIRQTWKLHQGSVCVGVNWTAVAGGVEEWVAIAEAMGPKTLVSIVRNLALCGYNCWSHGMPDLFLWRSNPPACRFIEVKGPGDDLSVSQMCWIDQLVAQGGAHVELIRVRPAICLEKGTTT